MKRIATVSILALMALGCGDDGGGNGAGSGGSGGAAGSAGAAGMGGGDPSFTQVYNDILMPTCAAVTCHGGGDNSAGDLDMTSQASAYTNLVGVVATGPNCLNMGLTRVIPNDSASSLLVTKLGPTPPCPTPMPVGGSLSDAQISDIAGWIDSGAPNN